MGWQEILTTIVKNQKYLDQQTERVCSTANQISIKIYCKKGCCNCCSLAVNCSFPEALAISKCLDSERQFVLKEKIDLLRQICQQADDLKQFLRLFRKQLNGCPFLDAETGSCSTYLLRPFSCRALISTRNSSWCAIDYAELHPQEKEAFLSSLDPEIVSFPTHYLATPQEIGRELETDAIVAMQEEFHVSLSGNLLYQVWLELEHQISAKIPQGFAKTRSYLEENRLDLPFLLHLHSC
jgi:Fe-S-cluster containining protein